MVPFSTSRAVDSLTITPPGGATDSMRCAIPTCSPTVVYAKGPEPILPAITSPEFRPTRSCRRDLVTMLDVHSDGSSTLLDIQCRSARANGVVLERDRRAEDRHDPVTGELVHRTAIALDDR